MDTLYDASYMRSFYDTYGTREWDRLQHDPTALVNFHIHKYYLDRFIHRGDHVLDVGAGPSRFTIELARRGATVVVGDLSPVQLELNRDQIGLDALENDIVVQELVQGAQRWVKAGAELWNQGEQVDGFVAIHDHGDEASGVG